MRHVLRIFPFLLLLLALGACASVGPFGLFYTGTNNPAELRPGQTTNPGVTPVVGESCALTVLGLIGTGDWSVEAAIRAAGVEGKTLKNVTVDHRVMSVFIFYAHFCTRVTAYLAP